MKKPDATPFKIFFDPKRYVRVDEQGYASNAAEGSVGCVLPITDGVTILALKIPRLREESLAENAYIVKLTEREALAVEELHKEGPAIGLIGAATITDQLKYERHTTGSDESNPQNGSAILIQFTPDRPEPRIIAVKPTGDDLQFFPPTLDDSQKEIIRSNWDAVAQTKLKQRFDTPGYIIRGVGKDGAGYLESQMRNGYGSSGDASADEPLSVWYFGLPAIVYDWANGTLQAAVGTGLTRRWRISEYLKLLQAISGGLHSLHSKGYLHSDLRPANIMWSAGSGENPSHYHLSDYGSFATEQAHGITTAHSGNTLIGSSPASSRVSPFYAKERRQAAQRETAEVAVILAAPEPNAGWIIRLGWKSELFAGKDAPRQLSDLGDSEAGRISRQIVECCKPPLGPDSLDQCRKGDSLQRGDRIRLRDRIFEVETARDLGGSGLVVTCGRRVARVIHDKVAVHEDEPAGIFSGLVLSIPWYGEHYKWTAASDLFSLGAVALYVPFMNQFLPRSDSPTSASVRQVEEHFDEFFQLITNSDYFRYVWDDLSCFRHVIVNEVLVQHTAKGGLNREEVASFEVSYRNRIKLRDFARDIVKETVQFIPHVWEFLQAFPKWGRSGETVAASKDGEGEESVPVVNMADFILHMYFALGCLHRRSHLDLDGQVDSVYRQSDPAPFCQDRFEAPVVAIPGELSVNAIVKAQQVLESHREHIIRNEWMSAFDISLNEVPRRSNVGTLQVLVELKGLRDEREQLRSQAQQVLRVKAGLAEAVASFFGNERAQSISELLNRVAGPSGGGPERGSRNAETGVAGNGLRTDTPPVEPNSNTDLCVYGTEMPSDIPSTTESTETGGRTD